MEGPLKAWQSSHTNESSQYRAVRLSWKTDIAHIGLVGGHNVGYQQCVWFLIGQSPGDQKGTRTAYLSRGLNRGCPRNCKRRACFAHTPLEPCLVPGRSEASLEPEPVYLPHMELNSEPSGEMEQEIQ